MHIYTLYNTIICIILNALTYFFFSSHSLKTTLLRANKKIKIKFFFKKIILTQLNKMNRSIGNIEVEMNTSLNTTPDANKKVSYIYNFKIKFSI